MATIKGKWVFGDDVQLVAPNGTATSQNISFTSNSTNYSLINLTHKDGFGTPLLYYGNTLVYDLLDDGWLEQAYRTVDFGTTEQTVSDAFLTWMQANATPEAAPVPTDAVTIEYNGAVIASLKAGQSATLPCKDTLMHTDIVITVPEMGGEDVPEWDGSYTISGGLPSFTIDGTTYYFEEGMTWRQWSESEYNTGGYGEERGLSIYRGILHAGTAYRISTDGTSSGVVKPDVIITAGAYKEYAYTSSGGAD